MVHALVTREGLVLSDDPARTEAGGEISPQLTAFFTSAPIVASSAAVNSFSAKEVGHMAPFVEVRPRR
jgi:hypothetical protein